MRYYLSLLCFVFWLSCVPKNAIVEKHSKNDIDQLHQLMLGSFVVYSEEADHHLKTFNVTGTDSVVLYSVAFSKNGGYWVYSYEFMTSMPNDPTYTSIKQIKTTSKDTLQVLYYNSQKFTLTQILQDSFLDKNIDIKSLQATEKITLYTRTTDSSFLGKSLVYEDKDCHCLRQNNYQITPDFYNVTADFFTKKDKIKIDRPHRPNLLIRRNLSIDLLRQIAKKEYTVKNY